MARPLDDSNRLAWCNSVAYVVQDAQLGNGTIRQNITRFAPARCQMKQSGKRFGWRGPMPL
jgi:ABC-type multidrug transport system fused ATPase/permease subunit